MQTFFKTTSIRTGVKETSSFIPATQMVYSAKHNNGKTTAETEITIEISENQTPPSITYKLDFGELPPSVTTEEEALDKLADWMERTALAIRNRKREGPSITVYNSVTNF